MPAPAGVAPAGIAIDRRAPAVVLCGV